jgi:hypothetical protein
MFHCSYDNRNLDIQIRIDNLQTVHGYRYPLSWYESHTDTEIKGMHTDKLSEYVKSLKQ